VAYSPLGRGLLSGTIQNMEILDPTDFRLSLPRFTEETLKENNNKV